MKKTIIAVSLLLGISLLTGCNREKDKVAPAVPAKQVTSVPERTSEKTPDEIWREATPATRRSILVRNVRKTWRNVQVQNTSTTMTITHAGMDESGARQIINEIGHLATEAGFRRINLVRAGGMCQVTYKRPYCEMPGPIPGDSETGGTGCGPYEGHSGNGWTSTTQTYLAPCSPHTWVYDVPSSSDK